MKFSKDVWRLKWQQYAEELRKSGSNKSNQEIQVTTFIRCLSEYAQYQEHGIQETKTAAFFKRVLNGNWNTNGIAVSKALEQFAGIEHKNVTLTAIVNTIKDSMVFKTINSEGDLANLIKIASEEAEQSDLLDIFGLRPQFSYASV